MKIGRNDPCPCGSGKKYKKCCLGKEKTIPFPGQNGSSEYGQPMGDGFGMPPLHRMMGFETEAEYEAASREYRNYCEGLADDEDAPSFREYFFGEKILSDTLEGMDVVEELEDFESLEDARKHVSKKIDDYNASVDSQESGPSALDRLNELVQKGPMKAKTAVSVNRNIPADELADVPVIHAMQAYLEYIIRMGKKADREGSKLIPAISDELFQCYEEFDVVDFMFADGADVASFRIDFIVILLVELGYLRIKKLGAEPTDKGLQLLNNKYIKSAYFRSLNYFSNDMDWFYDSDYPEEVTIFQDFSGMALMSLDHLWRNGYEVTPGQLVENLNSTYPLLDDLSKSGIEKDEAVEIFRLYVLNTYCAFFGFALPVITEEENAGLEEDFTMLRHPWLLFPRAI
jgi:hypothetical protein